MSAVDGMLKMMVESSGQDPASRGGLTGAHS